MGTSIQEIKLPFDADNSKVIKSVDEIIKKVRSLANDDALRQTDKNVLAVRESLVKVGDATEKAKAKFEELSSQTMPTEAYSKIQAELERTIGTLDKAKSAVADYQNHLEMLGNARTQLSEVGRIIEENNAKFGSTDWERVIGYQEREVEVYRSLANGITYTTDEIGKMTEAEYEALRLSQSTPEFETRTVEIRESAESLRTTYENLQDKVSNLESYLEQNASAFEENKQVIVDTTNAAEQLGDKLVELENKNLDKELVDPEAVARARQELDLAAQKSNIVADSASVIKQEFDNGANSASMLGNVVEGLKGSITNVLSNIPQLIGDALAKGKQLVSQVFSKLVSYAKSLAGHLKSAVSHMSLFSHHSSSSHKSWTKTLWTITKALIGVRGLFALVRKIRSAMVEGFKNVTKESVEAASSLNLLSAKFMQLKNSVGAAITPLANMIAPVIARIIDLFTRAFNAVAMFFGALTGKKTVMVAKSLDESAGASLNDKSSGGSKKKTAEEKYQEAVEKAQLKYEKELAKYQDKVAKAEAKQAKAAAKLAEEQEKANGELASFDELNNLTSDSVDDTADALEDYMAGLEEPELELPDRDDFEDVASGLGGLGDMFEEVEIDSKISDLIDWLKKMWEEADFTELGQKAGEALKKFLDDVPWDAIQENAEKVGKSLATLINGFIEVDGLGYSIGKTFAEGLNTIFHALDAFVSNLHWRSVGHFIADTLNGWFENIDWPLIRETFVTGFRGLANSISQFIQDFHWDNLSDFASNLINTLTESIKTFFNTTQYDDRGFAKNNRWMEDLGYEIGYQISQTIKKIDWKQFGESLGSMVQALIDFIAGLIRGLKETDFAELKDAIESFFEGVAGTVDLKEAAKMLFTVFGLAIASTAIPAIFKLLAIKKLATFVKGALTASTVTESATAGGVAAGESAGLGLLSGLAAIFTSAAVGGIIGGAISKSSVGEQFTNWTNWSTNAEGFGDIPTFRKFKDDATLLEEAIKQVDKGLVYTTEDIEKMGLSAESVEKLNSHMEDVNTTLSDFRTHLESVTGNKDVFANMNTGDLLVYKELIQGVSDGWITSEQTLDNYLAKYERTGGRSIELTQEQISYLLSGAEMTGRVVEKTDELGNATGEYATQLDKAETNTRRHIESLNDAGDAVVNLGDKTVKLKDDTVVPLEEMGNAITTVGDNFVELPTKLDSPLQEMIESTRATGEGIKNEFTESFTNMDFGMIGESLHTAYEPLPEESRVAGANTVAGFQSGAEEQSGVTSNWFSNFFTSIIDIVKSIFQCHSPSVVFTNIGINVMAGLLNGLQSMGQSIMTWISNFIQNIVDAFSTLGQSIADTVTGWKDALSDFSLSGAVSNIGSRISNKLHGYASGQVIPPNMAAHLAVLGDNNNETEVVSPLSTMKEAMVEALATANIGGNSNAPIIIQIDGREVFRVVRDQNAIYQNQTGESAFA